MKITGTQRNAASLYWTQVLTGELNPKMLVESKSGLPPFMASMEAMNRRGYTDKLAKENPTWPLKFMNELDKLLVDADHTLILRLDYHPDGLLKKASKNAGIPEGLFPSGKLSMMFDTKGNLVVGDEKIDAEEFIQSTAKTMTM